MDIQESENDPVIVEGQLITTHIESESPNPLGAGQEPAAASSPEPTDGGDVGHVEESDLIEEAVPSEPDELPGQPVDADEDDFDSLRALTGLLLGGAIEGTSQLVSRLRIYEEQMREETAGRPSKAPEQEDELDRLRYAMFGLILDAQSTFRRNLSLWARAFDKSVSVTNQVTRPVTNSFLLAPIQRRIDRLARKGEESLAHWIAEGRKAEPHNRQLAKMTYRQIVDEFINQLAENPELQDLVAQQGISLAGEARDEVRERTVTADNLMEGIVRRILRRPPRRELPIPPPEVQRWANLTLDEYKIESLPDESDK